MSNNIKYGELPLIEVEHGFELFVAVFLTDDGKYATYEAKCDTGYIYAETFETLEEATNKAKEGYP